MPLDHLAIDRITEADLQALIDNGVAEGRDIELKAQSWGHADKDKHEFLADVSAFANTVGGHIVVGMQEKGGIAHALAGLSINPDQERLRLEQLTRDGLQPRIGGLQIAAVKLANGMHALVLRIPRSWNPPHRVVAQGRNRFYARASNGRYEPDVDQLRELFAVAPALAERIRDFRFDRLTKIRAGETPVPMRAESALVLHIVPFAAATGRRILTASELTSAERHFKPMRANSAAGARFNLDGLAVFAGGAAHERSAYTQIWRTGLVEAVRAGIVTEEKAHYKTQASPTVVSGNIERNVVDGVRRYLPALMALGVPPPYAVLVSLLGVRHVSYDRPTKGEVDDGVAALRRFDRDVIAGREAQFDDVPGTWPDQTVATLLRPAFDEIANAAGLDASPNFDFGRRWVPARS